MIKYQLVCQQGHEFDAWFRCSNTFDVQAATHQIECPHCGSIEVTKSIMAPKIARGAKPKANRQPAMPSDTEISDSEIAEVLRMFREEVESRSTYVGRKFAKEARDMHFDEKPKRDIWGEATVDEVRELLEDDVEIAPLPRLPEDSD